MLSTKEVWFPPKNGCLEYRSPGSVPRMLNKREKKENQNKGKEFKWELVCLLWAVPWQSKVLFVTLKPCCPGPWRSRYQPQPCPLHSQSLDNRKTRFIMNKSRKLGEILANLMSMCMGTVVCPYVTIIGFNKFDNDHIWKYLRQICS